MPDNGGTHGDDVLIEAGDVIVDLLDRIKERARAGDTGGGNGGGNNGSGGGGDGEDPMKGQPIDARILLDALKQMARFTQTTVLSATERSTDFLTDAVVKGREADQERTLALAKQLNENAMRLSDAVADRFEALERRVAAIGKAPWRRAG
jgi:hypothetical protein